MKIRIFLEGKEMLEYNNAESYGIKEGILTIKFKEEIVQIPMNKINKIEVKEIDSKNESASKKSTKKFLHD